MGIYFFSLIWAVILATPFLCESTDVIIVGAGIAGISAARKLMNEGSDKYNITILEARPDRYGGRIWTNKAGLPHAKGAEVDMGASWIHGSSPFNPIIKLNDKFVLEFVPTDTIHWAWSEKGTKRTDVEVEDEWETFENMMEEILWFKEDASVNKSVYDVIEENDLLPTYRNPGVLFNVGGLMLSLGTGLNNISANLYNEDDDFEGQAQVVLNGYSQIVDGLVNGVANEHPLLVTLGKQVTKVKGGGEDGRVQVTTSDNAVYSGDVVVVAVPLGVLKADSINFGPPLPGKLVKAIQEAGFGNENKLVLEFDQRFWNGGATFFGIAPRSETGMGMFNLWLDAFPIVNRPVLVGFALGNEAYESEALSDEQTKEKGLSRLRIMFGTSTVDSRQVVGMTRSRWYSDPFSRGSFSHVAPGNTYHTWDELAQPLCPNLHFAGEHTNFQFIGTVHGAYYSGERVARQIMNNCLVSSNTATVKNSFIQLLLIAQLYTITLQVVN